jgi:hypothetical protein
MYKTPKKLHSITILGSEIPVLINDSHCDRENAIGLYEGDKIILRSEYESQTEFIDTFTHECIHALHGILGTQFDPTLEEILANTTGASVAQIVSKLLTLGEFDK